MFAVGRYDPRAEDAAAAAAAKKKKKKTENKRKRKAAVIEKETNEEEEHDEHEGKSKSHSNKRAQNAGDVNKEDSTTPTDICREDPATGGGSDSSSVPFSSSDEDGDDDDDSVEGERARSQPTPSSLKVIAEEQQFSEAVGVKRRRGGLTDEGLDDFDMESTGGKRKQSQSDEPLTDQQRLQNAEISTAIKMSRLPIREAAKVWKLPPFLVNNLERDGYENFFPIQSLVIPDVIASERHAQIRVRDICCSAPTGSGKTLAFVLPVLNALSNSVVRRLRALAVLPSRDLATQVYKVFARYAEGSGLRVGLAIGQTDFEAEQKALIIGSGSTGTTGDRSVCGARRFTTNADPDFALLRHFFDPTNPRYAMEAYSKSPGYFEDFDSKRSPLSTPLGGRSAVDILVATPGRLIDHLDKTPGFTLQHLRFLIIDEADRLLNQSYQGWIQRVTTASTATNVMSQNDSCAILDDTSLKGLELSHNGGSFVIDPITWRKSMVDDGSSLAASTSQPVPLRKMLFSATLTRDPQKLASLGLVNPKHFDAHHLNVKAGISSDNGSQKRPYDEGRDGLQPQQRYSVPETLSEKKVVCKAEQKPLVLLALLLEHMNESAKEGGQGSMVVVFTSSLDSTHRLARLLQLLWSAAGYGPTTAIAEFSSALSQKQRSKLMRRCASTIEEKQKGDEENRVSVIVCSDGMSRGMDLPNVGAVVNYDVPRYAKTYVHRCGRTARAGKVGKAISVLKGGQAGEFVKMRRLINDPERVKEVGVKKDLVSGCMTVYQACVGSLKRIIEAEENEEMDASTPLSEEWVPKVSRSAESSSGGGGGGDGGSSSSSVVSTDDDEEEEEV